MFLQLLEERIRKMELVLKQLHEKHNPEEFVEKLSHYGIKCNTFGKQMIRFVTHLDISDAMIDQTVQTLKKIIIN